MPSPQPFYPEGKLYELVVYDLRVDGAIERYRSERAAWRDRAAVEALDEHHFALIIRPGLTGESAA